MQGRVAEGTGKRPDAGLVVVDCLNGAGVGIWGTLSLCLFIIRIEMKLTDLLATYQKGVLHLIWVDTCAAYHPDHMMLCLVRCSVPLYLAKM